VQCLSVHLALQHSFGFGQLLLEQQHCPGSVKLGMDRISKPLKWLKWTTNIGWWWSLVDIHHISPFIFLYQVWTQTQISTRTLWYPFGPVHFTTNLKGMTNLQCQSADLSEG
jgi:hypothetical protein